MNQPASPQPTPPVIQKPPPGPPAPASPPLPIKRHPVADRLTASELLFRVMVVLLLAGSLFLAWWSFTFVLAKPLKETRALNAQVSQLSREVDEMERSWTPEQQAELDRKFSKAMTMFLNEDVSAWARNLDEQAFKLNLVLNDAGVPSYESVTNLGVGKVNVRLEVTPAGTSDLETSYQRLLRLCQHLTSVQTRCDMPELTVAGGTNSVSRASMILNLWTTNQESWR